MWSFHTVWTHFRLSQHLAKNAHVLESVALSCQLA
jgi:hypothetical protein